jgi:hypothetical protein
MLSSGFELFLSPLSKSCRLVSPVYFARKVEVLGCFEGRFPTFFRLFYALLDLRGRWRKHLNSTIAFITITVVLVIVGFWSSG